MTPPAHKVWSIWLYTNKSASKFELSQLNCLTFNNWHILQNWQYRTCFWHLTSLLNHLSPGQGYFLSTGNILVIYVVHRWFYWIAFLFGLVCYIIEVIFNLKSIGPNFSNKCQTCIHTQLPICCRIHVTRADHRQQEVFKNE